MATVYRDIFAPVLFSLPPKFALVVSRKFKTVKLSQLCLGEFKLGRNCLQVKKGELYTGKNKPNIKSNSVKISQITVMTQYCNILP